MIRKFILSFALTILIFHLSRGQCSNFTIDFNPTFYPDNDCSDGDMTVCINSDVVLSSGNASWQFCSVSSNGTFCTDVFSTNSTETYTLCVAGIPCNENVQFYIDTWTAPNAGGTMCDRTFAPLTAALPVEYGAFSAEINRNQIQLNWTTLNEINSDFFIIERCDNDFEFSSIGEVPAKGFSSGERSYSFVDYHPLAGINYYRLIEVSKDGEAQYSQTISVKLELKSEVLVYPNPVTEFLYLESKTTNFDWEIFDNKGRAVLKGKDKKINLQDAEAGIYYIHLKEASGQIVVKRIIKQ